jgi:hypothetical protein
MGWVMEEDAPGKNAMGTSPKIVVRAVIRTGRNRTAPASIQASRTFIPLLLMQTNER